jgi:ribonuclease Z
MSGTWRVHDVSQDDVSTSRFELCEASATKHYEGICEISVNLFVLDSCTIEAHVMNHGTPSLAYVVRERAKWNADTCQLAVMGLRPWPVLKQHKNSADTSDTLAIDSLAHSMATLRGSLVTEIRGHSIAYLTDFILDEEAVAAFLVHWRNAARSYAKHSIEIQTALLLCETSI